MVVFTLVDLVYRQIDECNCVHNWKQRDRGWTAPDRNKKPEILLTAVKRGEMADEDKMKSRLFLDKLLELYQEAKERKRLNWYLRMPQQGRSFVTVEEITKVMRKLFKSVRYQVERIGLPADRNNIDYYAM